MSLRDKLIGRIGETGPISIAEYMQACLHDPEHGYYATRPRLGAEGDFITAPHVTQMFGEMLGLWAIDAWIRLGEPSRFRLVELGPGDGSMMGDMLRAARASPAFLSAAEVWLVETSGPLRAAQARALSARTLHWSDRIEDLPSDAPIVLVANEFLDCLPIRQDVLIGGRTVERRVGVDGDGRLTFVAPGAARSRAGPGAPAGQVIESSPALVAFAKSVAALVTRAGGAALFIDYGRAKSGAGDTLQALRGHEKESPLAHPGEADLTVHVDFPAFVAAARDAGALASPLLTQGDFLRGLGIERRAEALARANPTKAGVIGRQLDRLIAPGQMGRLFKVACIHARDFAAA